MGCSLLPVFHFSCCTEPWHARNGQQEPLEKLGQGNSQALPVSSPRCIALRCILLVFQQLALSLSALQSAWRWSLLGVLELFGENKVSENHCKNLCGCDV